MESTPDVLYTWAATHPDDVAVVVDQPGGGPCPSLTFRELNDAAARCANALIERLATGDRIVWCGPNSAEVLTLVHAARKAGVTAVPLSYRFSADEMAYVIDNAEARLVFVDSEVAPTVMSVRDRLPHVAAVVVWGDPVPEGAVSFAELLAAAGPEEPEVVGRSETGAQMIYTSGTTGKPKGALRTRSDRTIVSAMVQILGLRTRQEVHITTGPLYHSGPLAFAQINQSLGNPVIVVRAFDAAQWLRAVGQHRATNTFTAPTQLKRVVSLDRDELRGADLSSLRCVIANAAPVPYALKCEIVEKLYSPQQQADLVTGWLYEVYGSTELGVAAILEPVDQLRKPGSCGKAYGGIGLRIVAEDGTDAGSGVPGELFIASGLEMDGYHRTQESLTANGDAWKSVGDVAYLDAEGYLHICDRKKDLIISGGVNIYPAEIEAVLHEHPDLLDVAVLGVPDDEWGERVHAVIQWKPGATTTVEALAAFGAERMAAYKVPRSWEVRDQLPRTEAGKLLKRVLRDELWSGRDRAV
ncbi:MAG: AMP-binding protein [Acidimicrobiia bacterium]